MDADRCLGCGFPDPKGTLHYVDCLLVKEGHIVYERPTPCPRCKELEAMFKDRVFAAKAAEAEVDIRGQRIAKLERVANAARCLIGEYGSTVEEHYPEYCGLKEALKGLEG